MSRFKLLVSTFLMGVCLSILPYCQPLNTSCWPTEQEIDVFESTLNGTLIKKDMTNTTYQQYILMQQNVLYRTYPSFIILCQTHEDVRLSVQFAASHNIQISVISSGHDFAGKNSANNSLQINLKLMQSYELNRDKLTLTVETGLLWWPIYHIINESLPFDAVILGGTEGTVSPGYTFGGGTSPLSPRYGLSSDSTLEYYLVDANANIINVYNTTNNSDMITQLFWSLKGGGGSTFGVVLNMTFKLFPLPKNNSKYTQIICWYPLTTTNGYFIGNNVLNGLWNWIKDEMDPMWGGYFGHDQETLQQPAIYFDFLYYGDPNYSIQNAQPLTKLDPYNYNNTQYCSFSEYNTFYDFSITMQVAPSDKGKTSIYLWNDFITQKNMTTELVNDLIAYMNDTTDSEDGITHGWSGNLVIGGKVHNYQYGYTAVGKGFRTSQFVLEPYVAWHNSAQTKAGNLFGNKWENILRKYGNGIYLNEENAICPDCDWKKEFWGQSNYDKLLNVKQYYDPNQVFWCTHCVGSDL